jgi:hypothetical protein
MTTTYVERIDSGDYRIDNEGKWSGVRRFQSPIGADIEVNRAAISALSWTVNGIAMVPRAVHTVPDDPRCPKTALITAEYEFPADPNNFVVGRGYLSVACDTTQMRIKTTYDAASPPTAAQYIEGDTDANRLLGLHWKPVQGSNIGRVRRVIVRITTAYSRTAFDWDTYVSAYYSTNAGANGRPKKNSDACANILDAKAGELLMLGVDIPQAFVLDANNTKIPVIYTMLFQPGGVENDLAGAPLLCAQFQKVLASKYITHVTDAAGARTWLANDGSALAGTDAGPTVTTDARTRIVSIDKQLSAAAARTMYDSTAYSALNSLIYWGA